MKTLFSNRSWSGVLLFALFGLAQSNAQTLSTSPSDNQPKLKPVKTTIHQFKVEDISGSTFDFSKLKGKKVMVVNTASKCGLTPQYEKLEALYKKYKNDNFVIVGFPANNFGGQEPGTNEEIVAFCQRNYGVSFPMMAKISVKGDDMAPIYQFLTEKSKNGTADSEVEWNFQKYLLDENGKLVRVVPPKVLPDDKSITDWIKS